MPNLSEEYRAERERWRNVARIRPPNIVIPGPGQESVWGLSASAPGRAGPTAGPGGVRRYPVTANLVGPFKGVPGSESW